MAITLTVHAVTEGFAPGNSPISGTNVVMVMGSIAMDNNYVGSGGETFDLSAYMTVGKGMVIEPGATQLYKGTFNADLATGKIRAQDFNFVVQSSGVIGASMNIGLSANADSATLEGDTGITATRTLDTDTTPVVMAETAATTDLSGETSLEFIAWGTKK